MRRDFGFRDRRRHGPGRVEIDAGDFGGQRRRRFLGLADDHAIAPHHLVVFDRFGECRRQIHHHVALAECEIHIGKALERGLELLDPLLHGTLSAASVRGVIVPVAASPWRTWKRLTAFGDDVVIRAGRLVRRQDRR